MKQTDSIDFYNIIDLMGENNLSNENKNNFLNEMDNLITKEFIFQQVSSIKDEKTLRDLFEIMKKDKGISESINYLNSKITGFSELLKDFTRKRKKEFILDHFKNIIEDLEEKILSSKDTEKAYHLMLETKFYKDAINYVNAKDWLGLIKFFKEKDKLI